MEEEPEIIADIEPSEVDPNEFAGSPLEALSGAIPVRTEVPVEISIEDFVAAIGTLSALVILSLIDFPFVGRTSEKIRDFVHHLFKACPKLENFNVNQGRSLLSYGARDARNPVE
jgi:hypothetical protein